MKWAAGILLALGAAYMGYYGFASGGAEAHPSHEHSIWVMPALGALAAMAGIVLLRGRNGLD